MAVVFRAYDQRLDRTVALKILSPALAEDENFRQRFIRESRAAAAVDDPYIIPVFEAGEASGVLFIASRFVGGGDVRSQVARFGPMTPNRAADIISQVASALDAAHARGLVHRDVKPANILLDASSGAGRPDHVYLCDFGLSKGSLQASGLTETGIFLGTLDYIAPEQIQGELVDGRVDQYALACTAFEMLTGAPPFPRQEAVAVMYAQLSDAPPALSSCRPGLSPSADQVFARALSKAPADRYPSCRAFAEAMRRAFGLRPFDSGPGEVPERTTYRPVGPAVAPAGMDAPTALPGGRQAAGLGPGGYPAAAGSPGGYPAGGSPGGYPAGAAPGGYPASGSPGAYPAGGAAGGPPAGGAPGGYPAGGSPGGRPAGGAPIWQGGGYPGPGAGPGPGSSGPGDFEYVEAGGGSRRRRTVLAVLVAVAVVIVGAGGGYALVTGKFSGGDKVATGHHHHVTHTSPAHGTQGTQGTHGTHVTNEPHVVLKPPACVRTVATGAKLHDVPAIQVPGDTGQPFGIAVSSDGKAVFVVTDSAVLVYKASGDTLTFTGKSYLVGSTSRQATTATVTPDGKYLLVASDNGIIVFDAAAAENEASNAILGSLQVPNLPKYGRAVGVAVTPDDKFAFVSLQFRDEVGVFNLGQAIREQFATTASYFVGSINVGAQPVGLTMSPDGTTLYATAWIGNSAIPGVLSVIDVGRATDSAQIAHSIVSKVKTGCFPARVAVTGDGKTLWVTTKESNFLLAYSASALRTKPGKALIAEVQVGVQPIGLALVDGGKRIVVSDDDNLASPPDDGNLAVVDTAAALGHKSALLGYIPSSQTPHEMVASPDGRLLYVTNYDGSKIQIVNVSQLP